MNGYNDFGFPLRRILIDSIPSRVSLTWHLKKENNFNLDCIGELLRYDTLSYDLSPTQMTQFCFKQILFLAGNVSILNIHFAKWFYKYYSTMFHLIHSAVFINMVILIFISTPTPFHFLIASCVVVNPRECGLAHEDFLTLPVEMGENLMSRIPHQGRAPFLIVQIESGHHQYGRVINGTQLKITCILAFEVY